MPTRISLHPEVSFCKLQFYPSLPIDGIVVVSSFLITHKVLPFVSACFFGSVDERQSTRKNAIHPDKSED